jgi:hypothetical protein
VGPQLGGIGRCCDHGVGLNAVKSTPIVCLLMSWKDGVNWNVLCTGSILTEPANPVASHGPWSSVVVDVTTPVLRNLMSTWIPFKPTFPLVFTVTPVRPVLSTVERTERFRG